MPIVVQFDLLIQLSLLPNRPPDWAALIVTSQRIQQLPRSAAAASLFATEALPLITPAFDAQEGVRGSRVPPSRAADARAADANQLASPAVIKRESDIMVEGAGVPDANGLYVRDGEYEGAPLFKKGQWWLLRYFLPRSGNHWWYIADKDQLSRDDGDLYRIKSEEQTPPLTGWARLARVSTRVSTLGCLHVHSGVVVNDSGVYASTRVSVRKS